MYFLTIVRMAIVLSALLLVSCIGSRQYTANSYYDLGLAQQQKIKLTIGSILQEGPYRSRMIFRQSGSEIKVNEYQRWTQSPDLMLSHYLKTGFLPGGEFLLEGEIVAFENDLSRGKAVFIFNYEIFQKKRKVYSESFRKEMDTGATAQEFAATMSSITAELLSEITEKIKSL